MTIMGSLLLTWSLAAAFLQLGPTPIWVPLTIILIIILIFWWGLTRNRIQDESITEDETTEDKAPERTVVENDVLDDEPVEDIEEIEVTSQETETVIEPDDLKLIEGIGPKISSILADAGIVTFAQLAESSASTLEKIVREDAGLRLADPTSWPEQARLAADGNWDELEQLQDALNAGRRK